MKRIIGLFAVLAMGSGCAIQTHYFQHGAVQPTNMVDADSVKVFSGPAPAGTCASSTDIVLEVQVLPRADHSERSESQLR